MSRLHRRTLLGGTLAVAVSWLGAGAGSAQAAPAAPAAPLVRKPKLAVRNGFRSILARNGSAVRMPVQLGARMQVTDPVRPGSTVTLTWDDRLYTAGSRVQVSQGAGTVFSAAARPMVDDGTHTATLTVTLPGGLAAGDYTLAAGTLTPAPAQYPDDLVSEPVPVSITVNGTAATVSQDAADVSRPWGASVGAAWQEARWDAGFVALYPGLVTFRAVGPAALPAGSRIRIALDARVFTGVRVTGAYDSSGRELPGSAAGGVTGNLAVTTWTPGSAVAAGERVTLRTAVESGDITGALDTFEAPVISFSAPAAHRESQRVTGEETLTREDNIYSARTHELFAAQVPGEAS
ncbi:hypothetical protein KIH74_20360 [Kineosporia sp. J2-2]|uniref:Uncharacterized protein n=1 Tax=Kineosporia corallincola TaxID=2835133 RepID=A0ABS5TJM9_9ACTN|nr:hypothetical protein [Kineosporia corallincola]MBT0771302.1 hypothetical protein [Kineosporia corallincola]